MSCPSNSKGAFKHQYFKSNHVNFLQFTFTFTVDHRRDLDQNGESRHLPAVTVNLAPGFHPPWCWFWEFSISDSFSAHTGCYHLNACVPYSQSESTNPGLPNGCPVAGRFWQVLSELWRFLLTGSNDDLSFNCLHSRSNRFHKSLLHFWQTLQLYSKHRFLFVITAAWDKELLLDKNLN